MSGKFAGLWAAAWRRIAPRGRIPGTSLAIRAVASDAPMRAMMSWKADWKTVAVSEILKHRRGIFIDVGANVGQTLLDFLLAPQRSSYLGFEPNLTCYQHLAAFISANRLGQCRLIPAALGDRNGITQLYRLGGDTDAGATTMEELRPSADAIIDPCCMFRLDDLRDQLAEPEIALIKIDTEGSELEILRGMNTTVRRTRPWILCEVLHRDERADVESYRRRCAELMQLVSSFGYCAQRVVQNAGGAGIADLEPVGEFPDMTWNPASIRSCDYLFVPASELSVSREVLIS